MYDCVIVGAGPGGIATALKVHSGAPDAKLLMLEGGRDLGRRPCPVDRGFACTGCGGICNVLSGFGGCVHAGDGSKLSLLPSGKRLVELFGPSDAFRLSAEARLMVESALGRELSFVGQDFSHNHSQRFASSNVRLLDYPVSVLSELEVASWLMHWRRLVDDGTDCITGAKVVEVSPIGRKWLVKYLTKGGTCAVPTRSVVFATGRAGVNWVAGQLKGLGVPTIQSQPSIGVRFEMSASRLDVAGREHPDLKGSIVTSEGRKAKTFCFCGGRNGGRIKFTHYQSEFDWPIVTLDGHVTSDRPASGTELSGNFGVLTQLKAETSSERMSAFLSSYWLNFHGRPIAQSLQDFSSRRDPARNPLEGLSFSPSVNDFAPGRLDMLFDDFEHKAIVEGFAAVMGGVERGSRAGAMDQDILVLGPEIEFLWDRPVMDATGMVSSAGLWVVGDAAGVAQGIVQAIMFGLAAGAGILNFLNS